jgi:NADH:ubiquinone oxidoreductase subunit 6 (subunit J)
LLLDLLTVLSRGAVLLRRLANLIPLAILGTLLYLYQATVLWTESILRRQHRSKAFGKELFTSYPTLFALVGVILVYYIFGYEEAGTYKSAFLDWFG